MRVVGLVASLVGGYLVVSTGQGRAFFQLAPLPWEIVTILLVIAAAWTGSVIGIHRTRIVQRGIDILIAGWQRMAARRLRVDGDPGPRLAVLRNGREELVVVE
jgi:hypothetical protein